jgi:transposase-like protein
MEQKEPSTLLEAVRAFADSQVAHDYFLALRFPNGVACPRHGCGSADVARIKNRNAWRCRDCNRQFSVKVGTIFEDSPIGFDKWLPAMWLLSANRNGISSCEIARGLGVTQKTAWFMLHRLRHAMKTSTFEKLSGEVEVDETYFGGAPRHRKPRAANLAKHGGTGYQNPTKTYKKTAVMGFRERGGNVRAFVIPDDKVFTLDRRVRENVALGSTLYTDAHPGYVATERNFRHFVINHSVEYVRGNVHTNNIENFWSVLKRTIGGTYICPRAKHLDRYLDEQIFRFNERENKDGPRFAKALKGADSKRLTWKALVAKPAA